jgi:mRNA interferase YafQ
MVLLRSTSFVRAAKKFISKHPQATPDIQEALQVLSNDPSDLRLKTHKLKGELKGSLACSAGYDCRIVFSIVQHEGKDAILL